MTQEDKQLLLLDLSARLPYGVMCHANEINLDGELLFINKVYNIVALYNDKALGKFNTCPIADITPYLRPMSSMTKEERKIYAKLLFADLGGVYEDYYKALDYLNAHHFDYRGLIEKGLAIEVTESNNPYEN